MEDDDSVNDFVIDSYWAGPQARKGLLRVLGFYAPQFPSPHSIAASTRIGWSNWSRQCSVFGILPIVLGVAAAGAVFFRSFCCRGGDDRPRPSTRPLSLFTALVLLLVFGGLAAHLRCFGDVRLAREQLEHIGRLAQDAVDDTSHWRQDIADLRTQFGDFLVDCEEEERSRLALVLPHLETGQVRLREFLIDLQRAVGCLRRAQLEVNYRAWSASLAMHLPTALVVVACVLVLYLARRAADAARDRGRCVECLMRLSGVLLIAPAILFVSTATAVLCALVAAVGSFCREADRSVLTCVGFCADDMVYNITLHHIIGSEPFRLQGPSFANRDIQTAMSIFYSAKAAASTKCRGGFRTVHLEKQLRFLTKMFPRLLVLLDRERIHPYYRTGVHDLLCGRIAGDLTWLACWHFAAGVVCLPVLAYIAIRFFERLDAWRSSSGASNPFVGSEMTFVRRA